MNPGPEPLGAVPCPVRDEELSIRVLVVSSTALPRLPFRYVDDGKLDAASIGLSRSYGWSRGNIRTEYPTRHDVDVSFPDHWSWDW